ncbi:hypothetical protein OKA05_13540 [Luteolibacter arcticus]|uniref:Uncharacterized protein n=1 Tax=Luteolibacter arcticus TaxID=1581411 RepID=A0ABT3GJB3_9BACT|nr:hypothetical protein [Luteolibacter arcticus]MCW1923582.1 hypothetical protein [Luteolibacter arcticus]
MKIALIAGILLTIHRVSAVDFGKLSDGQSGRFISTEANPSFHSVPNTEASWIWVLRDIKAIPHPSTADTWIFSGELRHFNVGTAMEGYPIFFGGPDRLPSLAAVTDSQGKFSFTLHSSAKKSIPMRALTFDPTTEKSWIFVGGLIEQESQSPLDSVSIYQGRFRLKAGSHTWRYPVGDLLKTSERGAATDGP